MKKAILAKKIGMTQIFLDDGKLLGVTVLLAGPCVVIQKKSVEKEGYNAVKVAFGAAKPKQITKPVKGQFKDADIEPLKYIKEFRLEDTDSLKVGDSINADIFTAGEKVDISGVSKGKGFQGSIKRHGFGRGPVSHGSKYHRGSGALSAGTFPGRVQKGRKLPGQMGNKNVTAQNLEIVRVIGEKNIILVKGPVPGANNSLLYVRDTVKE